MAYEASWYPSWRVTAGEEDIPLQALDVTALARRAHQLEPGDIVMTWLPGPGLTIALNIMVCMGVMAICLAIGRGLGRVVGRRWKVVRGALVAVGFVVSLFILFCGTALATVSRVMHGYGWTAAGGQLRLIVVPGKWQSHLEVAADYQTGMVRTWEVLSEDRVFSEGPQPEAWFQRALLPMGRSDAVGLARFYPDATHEQRRQIVAYLRDHVDEGADDRARLRELFESGEAPWLSRVLESDQLLPPARSEQDEEDRDADDRGDDADG